MVQEIIIKPIKNYLDDNYPYAINYNVPSLSNAQLNLPALMNLKPKPNIESNPLVNHNFIPNENMAQQGIYGLNTDPAMDALINLVSLQRKEIKKMEKLMTPQRASEFVYAQNHIRNKDGQMVEKKNQKFGMLNVQDYDGDGLKDTIVTKDGKVYSFNGFHLFHNFYKIHLLNAYQFLVHTFHELLLKYDFKKYLHHMYNHF
jgi:hypothetical protein